MNPWRKRKRRKLYRAKRKLAAAIRELIGNGPLIYNDENVAKLQAAFRKHNIAVVDFWAQHEARGSLNKIAEAFHNG